MFDDNNIMPFDIPTANPSCIIKVIGVGGGGGNAVNHMYKEKIHDVAFVVCNTDSKALEQSPVPVKLQLGHEGLGAGNRPQKAREAAEESLMEVQRMLDDGTKMVFMRSDKPTILPIYDLRPSRPRSINLRGTIANRSSPNCGVPRAAAKP